jgi:hypothetical protein
MSGAARYKFWSLVLAEKSAKPLNRGFEEQKKREKAKKRANKFPGVPPGKISHFLTIIRKGKLKND